MKTIKVFGIPVPIVISRRGKYDGESMIFYIRVKPWAIGDAPLIEHEAVHIRQTWSTLGLHLILYYISKNWRYKSEIEGYRKQLSFGTMTPARAARLLLNGYDLGSLKTEEQILRDLTA